MQLPKHWQVYSIQLLAVVGLLIAYYLWLFHEGSLIAACSGIGWDDCGQVSGPNAPYSSIGNVSVALIGLLGYALIFLITWLKSWIPRLTNQLPELLIGVTGIAFLFSIGLTGLELFVIHAFCRYCLMLALITVIIFILSISYLLEANSQWRSGSSENNEPEN